MDRLELAIRRFKQIVPDAVPHAEVPLRSVTPWLKQCVLPAIEELVDLPLFRELASWTVRTFRDGASSPEAEAVNLLESEFQKAAQQFVKFANAPIVRRHLIAQNPRRELPSKTALSSSRTGVERWTQHDELLLRLSRLKRMADGRMPKFVNAGDYLTPQAEWSKVGAKKYVQHASSIVSLNPELPTIGDFVTQRLEARVREQLEILAKIRQLLGAAVKLSPKKDRSAWARAEVRWKRIVQSEKQLQILLAAADDRQLRDACVCATQIYAALAVNPDLSWLGLTQGALDQDRVALVGRLTSFRNAELFDSIARTLHELRRLRKLMPAGESEFQQAVKSGGLVIDCGTGSTFWDKKEISPKLRRQGFQFLRALAIKSRLRQAVDVRDLSVDPMSSSFMSSAWGRLKTCLPASLHKLVKPGSEPQTYLLEIEPHRVCVFERLSKTQRDQA
jgi:hypothetical protein